MSFVVLPTRHGRSACTCRYSPVPTIRFLFRSFSVCVFLFLYHAPRTILHAPVACAFSFLHHTALISHLASPHTQLLRPKRFVAHVSTTGGKTYKGVLLPLKVSHACACVCACTRAAEGKFQLRLCKFHLYQPCSFMCMGIFDIIAPGIGLPFVTGITVIQ
jgi:hypothetical protein